MFDVLKKYASKIAPQAFAQMGFLDAKFATNRPAQHQGRDHREVVQPGGAQPEEQKTDILCKPFYVGNALPYHIPNNTFVTVDYKGGKVVVKRSASTSRQSTPRSPRREPGRRSTSSTPASKEQRRE